MILAIVSSRSPRELFWECKSSQQTANIRNTSATHAAKGYIPIACALQGSIGVQNVLVTILHAPKTIFQHWAEFSRSETQKNGMPMTISSSQPKIFNVTTLGPIKPSFSVLQHTKRSVANDRN